jgi:hypothetical protein
MSGAESRFARRRILMILTHDRLDCLQLCLDMLERADAFSKFDRVVLLLNGVPARLRRFVERYMAARPQVGWDTVEATERDGGAVPRQNECIGATRIGVRQGGRGMSSCRGGGRSGML